MIEVEFNGGAEIERLFERVISHLADPRPLMQDIGAQQIAATRARFLAGLTPDGSVWAPKSPATLAAQAARGDPVDNRPLIARGTLHRTLNYQVGADGQSVTIGSGQIYAAVQQFGAAKGAFGAAKGAFGTDTRGRSIPWGDIPARPYLGLSDQDRTDIAAIITEWLESAVPDRSGP